MNFIILNLHRLSYISVDSGRSSDTYAETSASSISSSSSNNNNNNNSNGSNISNNHSNRLNSNASNCSSSADSGTEVSRGQSTDCSSATAEKAATAEEQLMRVTSSEEEPEGRRIYCCSGQGAVPRRMVGPTAATPPQPEAIYARIQV